MKNLSVPYGAPIRLSFWLFRLLQKRILWHFEVLLLFLSLRYGTVLSRSRLVLQSTFRINARYESWRTAPRLQKWLRKVFLLRIFRVLNSFWVIENVLKFLGILCEITSITYCAKFCLDFKTKNTRVLLIKIWVTFCRMNISHDFASWKFSLPKSTVLSFLVPKCSCICIRWTLIRHKMRTVQVSGRWSLKNKVFWKCSGTIIEDNLTRPKNICKRQ